MTIMPNNTRSTTNPPRTGSGGTKANEVANASQANQKKPQPHDEPDADEPDASTIPGNVAKEFAKLTALILEKSDAHDKKLEAIWVTTSATDSKLAEITNRISQVESRLGFLEEANERQQANPPATVTEVEALRQKLDDIENRERRNNLRFIGFPEGCEDGNTMSFLIKCLPEILNLDSPGGLEIDRAHRIGGLRKSSGPEHPSPARPIIARFLRFQDRNRIAEAARKMGIVTWKEHRIMVFADYSKLVNEKRIKFNECKKMLHEKRMRFSLDYPAVLTVRSAQGPRRFDDHKKALAYIHSLG